MMNTATSYIDKMLEDLSERFPNASIHYAFFKQESIHTIDMMGSDVEELSADDWAIMYDEWVEDFESKFSDESLLFVREGDLVRVTAAKAQRIIAPKHILVDTSISVDFSYEWISDSLKNAVTSDFVYGINRRVGYSSKAKWVQKIVSSESPPSKTEHTYSMESVPAYVGTDSFCSVR